MRGAIRIIVVLLVGVLLLAAGVPAFIGLALERFHPELVAGLDQRVEGTRLENTGFSRGWLRSAGFAEVLLPSGERLRWSQRYRQGPGAAGLAWLAFHGELTTEAGEVLVRADGRVTLLTGAELEADITWNVAGRDRLLAQLRARVAPGGDRAELWLEGGEWLREDLFLSGASGYLDLGPERFELKLAADQLSKDESTRLLEPALEARLELPAESRWLELHLDASARQLDTLGERFAEPRSSLSLERLHRPTILALLRDLGKTAARDLAPELERQAMQTDLLLAVPELLKHRPELRMEGLEARSAEGPLQGDFRLTLSDAPPPGFLADPLLLSPVLESDGHLSLPSALAERLARRRAEAELGPGSDPDLVEAAAQDWLARMRANQLLVRRGATYELAFDFAKERLTINGQQMRLPTF